MQTRHHVASHELGLVSTPFVWAAALLAAGIGACGAEPETDMVLLPARFDADGIYLDLETRGGDTLRLFTDTGGGLFIFEETANRVGWGDSSGIALGTLAPGSAVPDPLGTPEHRVPIYRPDRPSDFSFDGMLGQAWFADRIWTLDFGEQKMILHQSRPEIGGARTVPLGFLADSTGVRLLSFPRIDVVVGGDSLSLLLDSGATVTLTSGARIELDDDLPPARSTSFITSSLLDRWTSKHPAWRVVSNADSTVAGMRMIEVPEVTIAGIPVGPVWFTERPDPNFLEYMSQWTDRLVEGALGGSALRYFRVTLDYSVATASFELTAP